METVFLRTAPGLEDLIKQEVLEALGKEPPETRIKARSGRGWVEVVPPPSVVPEERFKNLRTVFRSMILKASAPRGESKPEAEALKLVQKGGFHDLRHSSPFRITCYAPKEPSGTRRMVEQLIGTEAVRASGAPVDLTRYDLNYGLEFLDDRIFFGTVFKDEEEAPRYKKTFQVRSSVKPHIAAAMLRLVGFASRPGTLLDPCCGSGTILLEAASIRPESRLYGVDVDPLCAKGAQKNLLSLFPDHGGSRIYQGDARKLEELFPADGLDYLVTNPPFGIRTGTRINFYWFYRGLLNGANRLLNQKGRIALLIGRQRGIFNRAVKEDGNFRAIHIRVIDASGLFPALYVLARTV
ncbi:methyltransferase [Marispirochaeta aestuarii]|uniref:TRM11 family SAM-dependent methyltransferase n=1 Tax=Marispirochaeta aestuarii TaxID=1963862 RepID=UPI0029C631B1|nr:methyltransferase [Marispirochaeta aestuarii]